MFMVRAKIMKFFSSSPERAQSKVISMKTLKVRGLELKNFINLALIAMDEVCSCERHSVAMFRNKLHCHPQHVCEKQ